MFALIDNVMSINPYVMQEINDDQKSVSACLQKILLNKQICAFHFSQSFSSEDRVDLHVPKEIFANIAENIIKNHIELGIS